MFNIGDKVKLRSGRSLSNEKPSKGGYTVWTIIGLKNNHALVTSGKQTKWRAQSVLVAA